MRRIKYQGRVGLIIETVGQHYRIRFDEHKEIVSLPRQDCEHYIGDQLNDLIINVKPKGQVKHKVPLVFQNYQF